MAMRSGRVHAARAAAGLALAGLALAGCGTTVAGRQMLAPPDAVALAPRLQRLPVTLHGALPGRDTVALLALASPPPAPMPVAPVLVSPVLVAGPYVPGPGGSADREAGRLVFILNPIGPPPPAAALCRDSYGLRPGPQLGDRTRLFAVLCKREAALASASASFVSAGRSDADIRAAFATVKRALAG